MSFRRLNNSDFNDVIDLVRAIYALGPGGCGATCGYTCAEIVASLRVVAPDNDLSDAEVCNLLRAGKNSGAFNAVCMASVSQAELRDLAASAQATALARNGGNVPCGVLCDDQAGVSSNGIVNDPVSTDFSVCVSTLEDMGITNEPLYIVNQNMARVNPANQQYVDAINAEAQSNVRRRRLAAGLAAVPPPPCGVLCEDSDLQTASGGSGGGFGACAAAFNGN